MSNVTTFAFNNNSLRVIDLGGSPWFVAAEICTVLYGRTTGLTDVFARLSLGEVKVVTRSEVNGLPLFGTSKANRIRLVSESGLYKLIMRSDKPEAKAFQNWVTQVVLPAIRKDGAYVMGEEKGIQTFNTLGKHLGIHGRTQESLVIGFR